MTKQSVMAKNTGRMKAEYWIMSVKELSLILPKTKSLKDEELPIQRMPQHSGAENPFW